MTVQQFLNRVLPVTGFSGIDSDRVVLIVGVLLTCTVNFSMLYKIYNRHCALRWPLLSLSVVLVRLSHYYHEPYLLGLGIWSFVYGLCMVVRYRPPPPPRKSFDTYDERVVGIHAEDTDDADAYMAYRDRVSDLVVVEKTLRKTVATVLCAEDRVRLMIGQIIDICTNHNIVDLPYTEKVRLPLAQWVLDFVYTNPDPQKLESHALRAIMLRRLRNYALSPVELTALVCSISNMTLPDAMPSNH